MATVTGMKTGKQSSIEYPGANLPTIVIPAQAGVQVGHAKKDIGGDDDYPRMRRNNPFSSSRNLGPRLCGDDGGGRV